MTKSSRQLHVILDFDKTITTKDTIQILGQISQEHHSQRQPDEPIERLQERWTECVKAYLNDYDTHIASYPPTQAERTSIDDEIEFQRSLREIENRSVDRISAGAFFKGISAQDWREAARKKIHDRSVEVRKGFKEFIDGVEKRGELSKWGVVSVNWSETWIKSVLSEALGSSERADRVTILANDVSPENGIIVGAAISSEVSVRRRLLTCEDKWAATEYLLGQWKSAISTREPPLRIYIGDSLTDIECLLGVDIGIVVSDDGSGSLLSTLRHIGLEIEHIGSYEASEERSLWWAHDFQEIGASLLL